MTYDIIGDIHGYASTLERLLQRLGYTTEHGVYRHPERQVLFLGDFLNRGPAIPRVVQIVRGMVEAGTAKAVMGNHEYNAICYFKPNPSGMGALRVHDPANRRQIEPTIRQYEPAKLQDDMVWLSALPLWLEIGGIRIIHACWKPSVIEWLQERLGYPAIMTESFLIDSASPGSPENQAIRIVLNGLEVERPPQDLVTDQDGKVRTTRRVTWWRDPPSAQAAVTYDQISLPGRPVASKHVIGPRERAAIIGYPPSAAPLFIGHYCMTTGSPILEPNLACLDRCVTKGGPLCAYRWDGERRLSSDKIVAVERQE